MTNTIPRYPTGTLVKLFPNGVVTGTIENVVANDPPQYWVKWDDGNFFDDIQNITHWQPLPKPPQE